MTKSQGVQAAGNIAISAAPFTGIAAPFVALGGQIAALIGSLTTGCGQTCVAATQIVNQLEPYLKQNVAAYLALPTPRAKSAQQAALSVFNQVWNEVVSNCNNASLGEAGQKCISDRQRGGKWDWFSYYYDPIASDTNVYDDSLGTSVSQTGTNIATGVANIVSGSGPSWVIPAALVAVGAMFLLGGRK